MPNEQGDQPQPKIMINEDQMAGVWANWARVQHSPYEFTLDFVRMDFAGQPPQGIVVSRVSVSPLLVSQLIDALNENWSTYTAKAMPPEVTGRDEGPTTPI